jgi:hypothetical protein
MARKLAALTVLALSWNTNVFAQQEGDAISDARFLLRQGKNAEAIARLKALAGRRPEMRGVNHELGIAYYRQGEYL